MIKSDDFLTKCKEYGYTLFSGTPCSYLKPFINKVIDDKELDFIEVTNEGDAVALVSGSWCAGKRGVVMFQNSGLGNAINPLTSLSHTMKIPFIGIVTLRGEVGGAPDEPQHELMGKITTGLLEQMEIPWKFFPTEDDQIEAYLKEAHEYCEKERRPFFFVMKKASVDAYELQSSTNSTKIEAPSLGKRESHLKGERSVTRTQALSQVKEFFGNKIPVVATTGKSGRELFELGDSDNQFYMVGSMGCALPIGLGIAHSGRKVCVTDGDGAVMMRLGNLALAGQMKREGLLENGSLVHVVLDNAVHDSTGGQRSYSEHTDLSLIAQASGFDLAIDVDNEEDFQKALEKCEGQKLSMIRYYILKGSPKDLGRPTVKPYDVTERLHTFLQK